MRKMSCPFHKIEVEVILGTASGHVLAPCGCTVIQKESGMVIWQHNDAIDIAVNNDPVVHPKHYINGPPCPHCGAPIECITITERHNFNIGNAIKYLWRAGNKDPKKHAEDLRKAAWYATREAERIEAEGK